MSPEPATPEFDPSLRRQMLMRRCALLLCANSLILGPILYIAIDGLAASFVLGCAVLYAAWYGLGRSGYDRLSRVGMLVTIELTILAVCVMTGRGSGSPALFYAIIPLCFALFDLGQRWERALALLGVALSAVFGLVPVALELWRGYRGMLTPDQQRFMAPTNMLLSSLISGVFLYYLYQSNARFEAQLAASRDEALRSADALAAALAEERRLQDEVVKARAAERAAQESAKLKARFLSVMSHELRTPLNGVLGSAQLLRQTALDPEQIDLVATVQTSARGLLLLLNDILDQIELSSGCLKLVREPLSLATVLRDATDAPRGQAAVKQVLFEVEPPAAVDRRLGDPRRLQQVLGNLVDNAVKFTARGGRVAVRCSAAAERWVRFEVEDTGVGIRAEDRERLFAPFEPGAMDNDRCVRGVGLGLSLCSQLVQQMGGTLAVRSELGVGSCFSFEALLPEEPLAEAPAPAPPPPPAAARSQRVLLAEDNAVNAKVATKLLTKLGHKVTHVWNGVEAQRVALAGGHDVVLMDLQMPECDGLTATRRLRAAGYRQPILAVTANAQKSDEDACRAAGMAGFLSKPLALERLQAALDHLDGERAASAGG